MFYLYNIYGPEIDDGPTHNFWKKPKSIKIDDRLLSDWADIADEGIRQNVIVYPGRYIFQLQLENCLGSGLGLVEVEKVPTPTLRAVR